MVLLQVRVVRFCTFIVLVQHAAGAERRRRYGSQLLHCSTVDAGRDSVQSKTTSTGGNGIYEFGRDAVLEEVIDSEENYRALLEVETMYLSMSLSMSMSDYDSASRPNVPSNSQGPTPYPSPSVTTTEAPIMVIASSDRVTPGDACTGQPSTNVTISLEVELAHGTEKISDDLTQILANYLSDEYPPCAESRRLLVIEGHSSRRDLQQVGGVIRLGVITLQETDEQCVAQSALASSCRMVNAEMKVFGGAGAATESSIDTSLQSMATNDEVIVNRLIEVGIVDLRVVDTATPRSDEEKSEANSTTNSADRNGESGRETMAIVLSVTLVSLVLVAILGWGSGWRRRRSHLAYFPTLEEQQYDSYRDGNANIGAHLDRPNYGFADSSPINSSTIAEC